MKCVHNHEEMYGFLDSKINCFWDMLMAYPEEQTQQTHHQGIPVKLGARKWFGIRRPKNKAKVSSIVVHLRGGADNFIQRVSYIL